MAQKQAAKRGPKPWVVDRTEVLESKHSKAARKKWQELVGEKEKGAAYRLAIAVVLALPDDVLLVAFERARRAETKP